MFGYTYVVKNTLIIENALENVMLNRGLNKQYGNPIHFTRGIGDLCSSLGGAILGYNLIKPSNLKKPSIKKPKIFQERTMNALVNSTSLFALALALMILNESDNRQSRGLC